MLSQVRRTTSPVLLMGRAERQPTTNREALRQVLGWHFPKGACQRVS